MIAADIVATAKHYSIQGPCRCLIRPAMFLGAPSLFISDPAAFENDAPVYAECLILAAE